VSMLPNYLKLCESELENCKLLLPILEKDPRLGMHLECKDYMFNFALVSRKIENLKNYLGVESTGKNSVKLRKPTPFVAAG